MEKINYTIAVLIYNVEKFLPSCIESCVRQSGDDIEILLIDDGSTDNSGAICDEYAEKDARIKVVHRENLGVSSARNTAIKMATGKWLILVDGDDVLSDAAIEYGRKYVNDDSDLLQFDAVAFSDNLTLDGWQPKGEEMLITGEALSEYHLQLIDRSNVKIKFPTYNLNPAWAKIWSTAFIKNNDLWYDEKVHKGEGTLFTFTASYFMKKVKIVPYVLYGYRINPTSIMHRFSLDVLDNQNVQWMQYHAVIDAHNESNDEEIIGALNRRGLYLIENAIYLGIAHPDCKLSHKEKKVWAEKLCGLSWVLQAAQYADKNGKATKICKYIINGDAEGLTKYCIWLRRKIILSRLIK